MFTRGKEMNNFELAKNYGATAYLVFSYLKEKSSATIDEVANETGICKKTASYTLGILFQVKLIDKDLIENNKVRYLTVLQ
jgi:predicted DNA-binding transcriptional regulator